MSLSTFINTENFNDARLTGTWKIFISSEVHVIQNILNSYAEAWEMYLCGSVDGLRNLFTAACYNSRHSCVLNDWRSQCQPPATTHQRWQYVGSMPPLVAFDAYHATGDQSCISDVWTALSAQGCDCSSHVRFIHSCVGKCFKTPKIMYIVHNAHWPANLWIHVILKFTSIVIISHGFFCTVLLLMPRSSTPGATHCCRLK